MRLSDYGRSLNRARINKLANGAPPYDETRAAEENIEVNVNDLSLTRLAHDARQQLYSAFFKPGAFFTARTDMGVQHKRQERGVIVTKEINRIMRRSLPYYECMRSKFALDILHGIGPSHWVDKERWCGTPLGVEDVLVPSNTTLDFSNLPFFAIWKSFTAEELYRLTHGPKVDPAWNLPVVNAAIKWAAEQTAKAGGVNYSEIWSPEKMTERIKQEGGLYASDQVQTIDCFDFYFWNDDDKESGWERRIIFDAEGGWGTQYGGETMPTKNLLGERDQFLYEPKGRKFASKLSELIHFQFADLSAVAPFRYHSVRSLGFLCYAAAHLQNRLRCKFAEAVFENLLCYMRVDSADDAERALKIELASRGIIDPTVKFLSPQERWQPNVEMSELGMQLYEKILTENSSSYVQNQNFSRDRTEKTKFQVMAEVNAMTTLVSAALQQSYKYQSFEYDEIFRRFCRKDSRDPDVREFRVRCLKRGIPEKLLVPEAWELEPERVTGSGNKTMEMAIAQQLMEWRNLYAPEAQQDVLRIATLSVTDDAALADRLVPETPRVSAAKHDAMLAFGSLMQGARVQFTADQNRIEICETLLGEMALKVQTLVQSGGMATRPEITGLVNVSNHIKELIGFIGQDKREQERTKRYEDMLSKLLNQVKAFAQRLAEQEQAQSGNGGMDAADKSKIMATIIGAKVKAQNARESHAQRTAQKQVTFEQQMRQKDAELQQDLKHRALEKSLDVAAKDLETSAEIRRGRIRTVDE